MANGGGVVPEEVVSDLFMVLQEHGVHKAEDGSNPKWKFTKQDIPEVKIPVGLSSVLYPGSSVVVPLQKVITEAGLDLDVALADVKLIAPLMRAFVKEKQPLTKAQVVAQATELLGRDLPNSLFGKLCFLAHIARPDFSKDEYVLTKVGDEKRSRINLLRNKVGQRNNRKAWRVR